MVYKRTSMGLIPELSTFSVFNKSKEFGTHPIRFSVFLKSLSPMNVFQRTLTLCPFTNQLTAVIFFCHTLLSNALPPSLPHLLISAFTLTSPFCWVWLAAPSHIPFTFIFFKLLMSSPKRHLTVFVTSFQSCPAYRHSLPLPGNFFSLPVCVCGTLPVGSRQTTASAAGATTAGLVEQGSAAAHCPFSCPPHPSSGDELFTPRPSYRVTADRVHRSLSHLIVRSVFFFLFFF